MKVACAYATIGGYRRLNNDPTGLIFPFPSFSLSRRFSRFSCCRKFTEFKIRSPINTIRRVSRTRIYVHTVYARFIIPCDPFYEENCRANKRRALCERKRKNNGWRNKTRRDDETTGGWFSPSTSPVNCLLIVCVANGTAARILLSSRILSRKTSG